MYHSDIGINYLILQEKRKIIFHDKVSYSFKELAIIKNRCYSVETKKKIHSIKKIFKGEIIHPDYVPGSGNPYSQYQKRFGKNAPSLDQNIE